MGSNPVVSSMGDWIDKGLAIGASFDFISPMLALLGDLMNGPSHTFLIPWEHCPMSGHQVNWLLKKKGVQTWGLMIVSGTLMISVRQDQAWWANKVLEQNGIPVENPPEKGSGGKKKGRKKSKKSKARQMPRQKAGEGTGRFLDRVNDFLDTPLW